MLCLEKNVKVVTQSVGYYLQSKPVIYEASGQFSLSCKRATADRKP
jgi:hypothetical protein